MASPPPTNSSATLAPDTRAPGAQVRAGVLGIGAYAPEDVITNLAFGGADKKLLHVVAGKSVFRIPVAVAGYSLYP